MNFLIIDDEQLAVDKVKRLLNDLNYTQIITTTSAIEGIDICKYKHFDVVFLDINMPEKDGLQVAKEILSINPSTHIIFVTAYDHYAVDSYKIGAIDYLLKPITGTNLQVSLNRVLKYLSSNNSVSNTNVTLMAKYQDKIALLKVDDIYYFEAKLNDTIAKTKDAEYFTNKKISELETFTQNQRFVKIHRSHIINIHKVSYLETIEQGKYRVYFKDIDEILYTSRAGAQKLREAFQNML